MFLRIPILALLAVGLTQSPAARAMILPPNHLDRQDVRSLPSNVSEQEFNQAVDYVIEFYAPLAEAMGAKLIAKKHWDDSTVNAYASRSNDEKEWYVDMYGGLARRPEITPDGLKLVVCHELGHHFGGFPFKGQRWAATEGEADYFATQACAKRIFGREPRENSAHSRTVDSFAKKACERIYSTESERAVCYRTAEAGFALATLLGALNGTASQLSFEKRDAAKVTTTYEGHPAAQCRLDTYFSGSLCTASFQKNLIPGVKAADKSSLDAEREAALRSCTNYSAYRVGLRPACWFASRL